MNRTNTFHLSQWEKSDRILMTDFNSDNSKIDAALAALQSGKADAAPVDTMLSNLENNKAELVLGVYSGNNASVRTITLGFQPKAVYVCTQGGTAGFHSGTRMMYGGLAMLGHDATLDGSGGSEVGLAILDNGFRVRQSGNVCLNMSSFSYYYVALR